MMSRPTPVSSDPVVVEYHRRRRTRQVELVLVFIALGILLVGTNFHPWALWPCVGLVVVITCLWVKRNFFEDR